MAVVVQVVLVVAMLVLWGVLMSVSVVLALAVVVLMQDAVFVPTMMAPTEEGRLWRAHTAVSLARQ